MVDINLQSKQFCFFGIAAIIELKHMESNIGYKIKKFV